MSVFDNVLKCDDDNDEPLYMHLKVSMKRKLSLLLFKKFEIDMLFEIRDWVYQWQERKKRSKTNATSRTCTSIRANQTCSYRFMFFFITFRNFIYFTFKIRALEFIKRLEILGIFKKIAVESCKIVNLCQILILEESESRKIQDMFVD